MVSRSKIMKKVNKSNPLELYLGCWQRVVQPPGTAEQDHAGGGDIGVAHIAAHRTVDDNAAETRHQKRKVERAALLGRRHTDIAAKRDHHDNREVSRVEVTFVVPMNHEFSGDDNNCRREQKQSNVGTQEQV